MDSRELGNAIVDTATYVPDSAYDALPIGFSPKRIAA